MTAVSETAGADAPDSDLKLVVPGRGVPLGSGVSWIGAGWRLFVRSPVMWIVAILILFVIAIVMGFVPFIGSLAFQVLNPVFAAGLVIACRSLEQGGEFELEHLFAGFKSRFGNLLVVGLLVVVGWVAIFFVCMAFVGFGVLGAILSGDPENVRATILNSGLSIALAGLVALALSVPLLMLYWFAPALVVMHGMTPIDAMKASFGACLRNVFPFLVYGIVMMLLAIVAAIPLGLGMLVWVPLAITSTYASYREIFTDPPMAGPQA